MVEETSISRHFGDVPDRRDARKLEHPLMTILSIAILGVLCGAEGWVDIERYGKAKQAWLASFLDVRHGIASHDRFGRVFRWLDRASFQECFVGWTQELCQRSGGQWVAVDGKQLGGSRDSQHERDGLWLVSAWASARWTPNPMKSRPSPTCWPKLDISDCVVSVDALGTQTQIAKAIVQGGADYVLALKGNQGTLYEDVVWLFEGFEQETMQGWSTTPIRQSVKVITAARCVSVG